MIIQTRTCYDCKERFESGEALTAHRESWVYDTWFVGQSVVRVDPGTEPEVPGNMSARRISSSVHGFRCLNPREVGMAKEAGIWYRGLTPLQRKQLEDIEIGKEKS